MLQFVFLFLLPVLALGSVLTAPAAAGWKQLKVWAEPAFSQTCSERSLCDSRTCALSRALQSPCSLAPFYCCAATLISVGKWVLSCLSPRISIPQWIPGVYGRELCKKRKDVVSMACCNLIAGRVPFSDTCGRLSDWCYQHTALLCLFVSEFESSEVIKLTRAFVAQTYTVNEQELSLSSWANN